MKQLVALLMLSVFVVGCGGGNPSAPPGKGPTAPQPGSAGYGQWDANTVQAFDQYCASAGDYSFSYQQWYLYCDCIAAFAGSQWSFNDFASNVEYYYYNVIIQPPGNGPSPDAACLQKAGMVNGSGQPQTAREVGMAEYMD